MRNKEKVKEGLERAVRNCNRNIHHWISKKFDNSSMFAISHTEVRGLAKNWIIRCLREIVGRIEIDKILREGNLYITVDDNNACISSMGLSSVDEWRSIYKDVEDIGAMMKELNYSYLRFNPDNYRIDDPSYEGGSIALINFDSIKKIKF